MTPGGGGEVGGQAAGFGIPSLSTWHSLATHLAYGRRPLNVLPLPSRDWLISTYPTTTSTSTLIHRGKQRLADGVTIECSA